MSTKGLAGKFANAAAGFHSQAVAGMGHHLACLWGEEGVRVNTIIVGSLDTQPEEDEPDAAAKEQAIQRERALRARGWMQRLTGTRLRRWQVPLGRVGQLNDLKGPLLLLASDAGASLTGQALSVDGGANAATSPVQF